ncbi:hypothetical protein SSX86_024975 [Deinandra increscens subsp. villosa]|uniref:Reverse transcriptase n=1 Tax=Deinandra increscens subsp. villosa TaxID=3103831 RepID=A0AAP0CH08_9ASTR
MDSPHIPHPKLKVCMFGDAQHVEEAKQRCFRELLGCRDYGQRSNLREEYTKAKREAKAAVSEAKTSAFIRMYERLESKEGENFMFKIAEARERRRRDLGVVKFMKGGDGRVLVKEPDIKMRWQNYFNNLFNGGRTHIDEDVYSPAQERHQFNCYCRGISLEEVKTALRKMGRAKAVGPDNIPIEVWKCLGEDGFQWLTTLFNTIFRSGRMPDQWRTSVIVPLYKNKGDA